LRGAGSFVAPAVGAESDRLPDAGGFGLEEGLAGALAAWEGAFRGCRASVAGVGSIMSGGLRNESSPNMREAPPDFEGRRDNLAET